jgi:hypothetical protein
MCLHRPDRRPSSSIDVASKRESIPCGVLALVCAWIASFSGCGGGGGGVSPPPVGAGFTITRSTNPPDAISGRSYSAYISTSLPLATTPTDVVTSCTLSGSPPSGMTAVPGNPTPGAGMTYCVLTMSPAPAAGQYGFILRATDSSTPPKTASQSYTLSIRPDFTFTTATLAQGVQGRSYGVSPLSQPEATNIGTTQGGLTVGSAPLEACTLVSVTPSNPGLTVALDATKTQCLLSSPSLTAAGTFAVTVSAFEAHISDSVTGALAVPPGSVSSAALPLVVTLPITLDVNQGSSWTDAVRNRPYGSGAGCTGGTCVPVIYLAAGGLGGYVFPASTPASMPAGMVCPAVSGSATYTCTAPAPGISAAPGMYNPSVTVTDTGNSATPPATAASDPLSTRTDTLVVAAPLALSSDVAGVDPPASGVVGRTYGNTGAGFKALVYDAAGGIPGASGYTFTLPASVAAPAPNGVPAAVVCSATNANTQVFCGSGSSTVTAAPGTYTFQVTVNDSGNAAIPSGSQSLSRAITINAEMTLTPPASPFADAVLGRHHGVSADLTCGPGANLACTPLSYTVPLATPGLGGPYTFTPNNFPAGFTCPTNSNNGICSNGTAVGGSAGTFNSLNVTVKDTANAATPQGSVTSTNGSMTVHPELNFTVVPGGFPDAVTPRSYGVGNTCGVAGNAACAPLTYAIQNNSGLGGYSYALVVGAGSGGFSCTDGGISSVCTAASVTAAAATYNSVHATVTDAGNGSTPANTVSSSMGSLIVHSELTLTPPGGSLPAAVTGRTYGQGSTCGAGGTSACATIDYHLANGLGTYVTPATLTTTAGTFTCPLTSTTYHCSSASITGSGSPSLSMSASETANSSTPGRTVTDNSQTLMINPEMNFTAIPTSPFATAVNGRTYGQGSNCGVAGNVACAPLTYAIQAGSGLGGYSYTLDVSGGSGGFTCTSGSSSTNCTSANVTQATGTYAAVHASVTDTANAATTSNTIVSSNGSLTVHAALGLNSPSSPYPDGENGVTYGTAGAGCTPVAACAGLVYTVPFVNPTISGLPPYAFSESNFPTNLNCTQSDAGAPAPNGTILTCSASSGLSAAGPFPQAFSPSVQVTDTANASVPVATVLSAPATMNVQAQLRILDTVLPNGLVGFQYNQGQAGGPGVTIKSVGGVGYTNWVGPGDGGFGACGAPAAATLPGTTAMTFDDTTQFFSSGGAPFVATDVSAADGAYTFQVCVTDTGNQATPQSAALPNPGAAAPLVANKFVFDVLNTFAYTAETTTNAVDVINTTTNAVVGGAIALGTAPTTNPNGVAVTPDGTRAYVTLSNKKFAVIDTITNAQVAGSPFSMPGGSTCTSLAGVAITNDGRAYFACPTSSGVGGVVDVISTAENATLVAELATGDVPTGVAVSPTVDPTTGKTKQVYVTLNTANQLVIITNSASPSMGAPVALTATNAAPVGLAAVTNPTGHVYVYIAKNAAGSGHPGVDIVDANTSTLLGAIPFAASPQVPEGVAVTPNGSEVYVTLTDSAGFSGEVWVVDNLNPPVSRTGSPFALPAPNAAAMNVGPMGVTIPPLFPIPTTTGFAVFLAQSLGNNLNVLHANPSPTLLALGTGDGATTTFSSSFDAAVAAGSVEVVAGGVTGFDDGAGSIAGTGIASGTINYVTGAVSVTYSAAPGVSIPITAFLIPTSPTTITLNGVNPAPQGIANIPLPSQPPGLP